MFSFEVAERTIYVTVLLLFSEWVSLVFSVDLSVFTLPDRWDFWPQQLWIKMGHLPSRPLFRLQLCPITLHVGCLYFKNKKKERKKLHNSPLTAAGLWKFFYPGTINITNLYIRSLPSLAEIDCCQKKFTETSQANFIRWASSFNMTFLQNPTCANIWCPWAVTAVSSAESSQGDFFCACDFKRESWRSCFFLPLEGDNRSLLVLIFRLRGPQHLPSLQAEQHIGGVNIRTLELEFSIGINGCSCNSATSVRQEGWILDTDWRMPVWQRNSTGYKTFMMATASAITIITWIFGALSTDDFLWYSLWNQPNSRPPFIIQWSSGTVWIPVKLLCTFINVKRH